MAESKTVKGMPWISGDTLYQEQILIVPGKGSFSNNIALIADIWDDLTSEDGTYKTNEKKNYFYWEVEVTDTENEDNYITIKFECPAPKEGLFEEPYDPEEVDGDYAKFWVTRYLTAQTNAELYSAVQRKEITFPGWEYVDQNGDTIEVDEMTIKNNDIGDVSNLLGMLF